MSRDVLKLLRKVVERGYVLEEELSQEEREIARKLVEKGVLKIGYTVSPEYVEDIVQLCKPRVVSIGRQRRLTRALQILLTIGTGSPLLYFGIYGLMLGYVDVAAFFILMSALVMYGASYISKKVIKTSL